MKSQPHQIKAEEAGRRSDLKLLVKYVDMRGGYQVANSEAIRPPIPI